MAVTPYQRDLTIDGKYLCTFVADTAAELPTTGIAAGSTGFAVDTLSLYVFDGSAWSVRVMRSCYALPVDCAISPTLTDAQVLFFGGLSSLAPSTTAALSRVYVPKAGRIIAATVFGYAVTAGSAESWTLAIRVNNAGGNTTIAAVAASATTRVWSNAALSIAVAAGDYLEIRSANPTWATNPANAHFGGVVLIEET